MTIVNDNSWVINKLETPLTDDARVIIYDRHMFIVPATGFLASPPSTRGLTDKWGGRGSNLEFPMRP
jgi:hypothetical protein